MKQVLTIITTRQIDSMDEFEKSFRESHTQLFGPIITDDLIRTLKAGKEYLIKSKGVTTEYKLETKM